MVENSKKPKLSKSEARKKKKLEKKLARLKQSTNIPAEVARSPKPSTLSSQDGSNYQLIFKGYRHDECQISDLTVSESNALIDKLSSITLFNSKTIKATNLIRDKIEAAGDYKSLYKGLEPAIELVEVKFAKEGRIFCYFVDNIKHADGEGGSSNYCCIIAIKGKHIKT